MPKSTDPFTTVTHKSRAPGVNSEATVIRKGSKAGEQFAKDVNKAQKQYAGAPGKRSPSGIERKASKDFGASMAGVDAKVKAKQGFKKGGKVK